MKILVEYRDVSIPGLEPRSGCPGLGHWNFCISPPTFNVTNFFPKRPQQTIWKIGHQVAVGLFPTFLKPTLNFFVLFTLKPRVTPLQNNILEIWCQCGKSLTQYLDTGGKDMVLTSQTSTLILQGFRANLPQNVPLWHVHYFELKAIKTQQTQEKLSPLP